MKIWVIRRSNLQKSFLFIFIPFLPSVLFWGDKTEKTQQKTSKRDYERIYWELIFSNFQFGKDIERLLSNFCWTLNKHFNKNFATAKTKIYRGQCWEEVWRPIFDFIWNLVWIFESYFFLFFRIKRNISWIIWNFAVFLEISHVNLKSRSDVFRKMGSGNQIFWKSWNLEKNPDNPDFFPTLIEARLFWL